MRSGTNLFLFMTLSLSLVLGNGSTAETRTCVSDPVASRQYQCQEDAIYSVDKKPEGLFLYKKSTAGQTIWTRKAFGEKRIFDSNRFLLATRDSGCVLVVVEYRYGADQHHSQLLDIWVEKYSSEGDRKWDAVIDFSEFDEVKAIYETEEGDLLIADHHYKYSDERIEGLRLVKLDRAGKMSSSVEVDPSGALFSEFWGEDQISARFDYAGNLLLINTVGYIWDGPRLRGLIAGFDPNGRQIFSKRYRYLACSRAFPRKGGGWIVEFADARRPWGWDGVAAIDENGDIEWKRNILGSYKFDAIEQVIGVQDDGVLVVQGRFLMDMIDVEFLYQGFKLIKLDSNGHLDWTCLYDGKGDQFAGEMMSLKNGNVLLPVWQDRNGVHGKYLLEIDVANGGCPEIY